MAGDCKGCWLEGVCGAEHVGAQHNESIQELRWQFFDAGIVIDAVKGGCISFPSFHAIALKGLKFKRVAQEKVILLQRNLCELGPACLPQDSLGMSWSLRS
ncbi:hypothetical protein UFOVP806_19 [uncultured Caudovirales phage]|uniref:Uncharacterized protein n=1 Tax=uncultured Caudovirales phage TaxID=2100421 RepID=A0A6J5NUT0_9CAUD|nr:hypothetical protein UFOVP806_19 [uncultured Caudovirales phage]